MLNFPVFCLVICSRLRLGKDEVMKLKLFFIALIFFCFLPACSHLDSTCLEVNWYELGRQDSTRGLKRKVSFEQRREICPIDSDSIYAKAYKNGFDAGLKEYCSFKTGYIYSLSQMEQEVSACPKSLKKEFIKGYEIGSYMKQIQSLQKEIQEKIQSINKKLENKDNLFSMHIIDSD